MTHRVRRRIEAAFAFATGVVALVALYLAVTFYGHPVAEVLVNPDASVTNVGWPTWEGKTRGLQFPERFVRVEGTDLRSTPLTGRGAEFRRVVAAAADAGKATVTVELESGDTHELPVRPLEPAVWWVFAGSLCFAGLLYLLAALIALATQRGSKLAHAFTKAALLGSLWLFLLFDYQTTQALWPLFLFAFCLGPPSVLVLFLRLPDDTAFVRRFPRVDRAGDAIGLTAFAVLVGGPLLGYDIRTLHLGWSILAGGLLAAGPVVMLVRFVHATPGRRRDTMRALLLAMVVPYVVGGAFLLFPSSVWWASTDVIAFPATALGPLAIAYAFVRYDLWNSRALLSRLFTRAVFAGLACVVAAGFGGAAAAAIGVPFGQALVASVAASLVATVLVVAGLELGDRYVFPARAEYKVTVEQLGEELVEITSTDEVARAIERTIRRFLPCDDVRVALAGRGDEAPRSDPAGAITLRLAVGELEVGTLRVGSKPGEALFTSEDLDLLRTIANQGALALAYAHAYQELEHRRRQQAVAWQGEREAIVETVAAEIAHEVRYPVNFFRSLFDRTAAGDSVEGTDVDIAREEVERLERIVARLKQMATSRVERQPVRLVSLCGRAEMLLRDQLGTRSVVLTVPDDVAIRCDRDQATQVIVNLLANALEATEPSERVGVAWSPGDASSTLVVWDTGPGFEGEASVLFAPWFTTKTRGTGLGLAIAHRLVRAHGWKISAARREKRTLFSIEIREEDVVTGFVDTAKSDRPEVA